MSSCQTVLTEKEHTFGRHRRRETRYYTGLVHLRATWGSSGKYSNNGMTGSEIATCANEMTSAAAYNIRQVINEALYVRTRFILFRSRYSVAQ